MSESDGRNMVCGDFPDAIIGIIIIAVMRISITPRRASSGLLRISEGTPRWTGSPLSWRYQNHASGTLQNTTMRNSRCWRFRSRLTLALIWRPRNNAPYCICVMSIKPTPVLSSFANAVTVHARHRVCKWLTLSGHVVNQQLYRLTTS